MVFLATLWIIVDMQPASDTSSIDEASGSFTVLENFVRLALIPLCGAIEAFQGLFSRRVID